jgi:hypothetical protein
MKVKLLVGVGVLLAFALPAQARAAGTTGVVVAKQAGGTFVLAAAHGRALTVHSTSTRARVGDRVSLVGSRLSVLGHVHRATIRGTVVRRLSNATLLAAGHSMIRIFARGSRQLASGSDDHGGQPGDVEQFQVGFDKDGDLVQTATPLQVGQAATVQIEGKVVSVSPFVVSVEGLPVAITVPSGMTLPTTLMVGDDIELTVQVTVGTNTFTLVSIGSNQNGDDQGDDDNGGGGDHGGGGGDD